MGQSVEIIPLGGLGEFGMNCAVLRCGEEMILIDAGVMFPNGSLRGLGLDLIVPDITFLKENRKHLHCILLTHGHEDHIGGLPFLVNEVPVPIYGSPLALGLVRNRLLERNLHNAVSLNPIKARQKLQFGVFQVEPLHMTHSMPDSFSFAFRTPAGVVIWSGDFKFDQSPIDSRLSDMGRLAEYGDSGVLLLCSDSTNAAMAGLTPSEHSIREPLRAIFRKAESRIFVSCFASSIHRLQVVMDLAREFDRQVIALGRSMVTNLKIAQDLGYLKVPPEVLQPFSEHARLAPEETVFLATGSQGEPRSAMNRLAYDQYRRIMIRDGDTVILSTRIIPGNERSVTGMINHFYRRGAFVYDSRTTLVHSSGHGFQADLKILLNLTRPRYFVPTHGEYRQLAKHAGLAADQGLTADRVQILESGQVLEVSEDRFHLKGEVPVGYRYIDAGKREEIGIDVIRERRCMAQNGIVLLCFPLVRPSKQAADPPKVILKGVLSGKKAAQLEADLRRQALLATADLSDSERRDEKLCAERVGRHLKRFLKKTIGKRPLIVPVFQKM